MMELLNVLKAVCYIVWSLVGVTTIGATVWGILFYSKFNKAIFGEIIKDKEEEAELKVVK